MAVEPVSVDIDAPLRLADAVEIAFPFGGMTVSGPRKERDKGRLVVEIIAGKEFVTLRAIGEMRKQCRVERSPRDSGSDRNGETGVASLSAMRSGSSSTKAGSTAQAALRTKLNRLNRR